VTCRAEVPISTRAPGEIAAEGGWSLGKHLQGGEGDYTKSKGKNFEDIPVSING
jgi:hypothetical protein